MNPADCPDPWTHDPDDVDVNTWSDIPVANVWKNTETGEILVQYRTASAVERNKYVERHTDPEKVKSRFRQIKDMISTDDVEIELDSITITGGRGVAKCRTSSLALEKAFGYMRGGHDGFFYES